MEDEEKPKLTEEEFVFRAIRKLRGKYKGIHSVYSGFNDAFRRYFGTNPVETIQRLAQEKKIGIRPVKGGMMLYPPEDAPENPENALDKVLEEEETEESGGELKVIGPAELEEWSMTVECVQCKKKYRFDESKLERGPLKVQCPNCENIFVILRNLVIYPNIRERFASDANPRR